MEILNEYLKNSLVVTILLQVNYLGSDQQFMQLANIEFHSSPKPSNISGMF